MSDSDSESADDSDGNQRAGPHRSAAATPASTPPTLATLARLTDSQPTPELAVPALRRICAYCIDFDPTALTNRGATHIICPSCQQRLRDDERRRAAPTAA